MRSRLSLIGLCLLLAACASEPGPVASPPPSSTPSSGARGCTDRTDEGVTLDRPIEGDIFAFPTVRIFLSGWCETEVSLTIDGEFYVPHRGKLVRSEPGTTFRFSGSDKDSTGGGGLDVDLDPGSHVVQLTGEFASGTRRFTVERLPAAAAGRWAKADPLPWTGIYPSIRQWTGEELLVFGGAHATGRQTGAYGSALDPRSGTWRNLEPSKIVSRFGLVHAFTGTELLVWGGSDGRGRPLDGGAAYNPATDKWRPIAEAPIANRDGAATAWTGRELIIWGGEHPRSGRDYRDGAAFDPVRNRWRLLPRSPLTARRPRGSAWTGQYFIVWGVARDGARTDGAAYDPKENRWSRITDFPYDTGEYVSLWADGRLNVLGSRNSRGYSDHGLPVVAQLPSNRAPWSLHRETGIVVRTMAAAGTDRDRILLFGGDSVEDNPDLLTQGSIYDPGSDTWKALPTIKNIGIWTNPVAVLTPGFAIVGGGVGEGPTISRTYAVFWFE